ncbi:MAG: chromosomal replication initiator protein DnaA [Actinomycetota bacterium]|nr:chromosomal replication initiator protein DnaA [Actinomycetota bacterium]
MAGAEHLWAACVGRLRDEFSESTWNTWLASARPRTLEGYRLTVSVPSALAKERIESRYLDHIQQVLAEVTGHAHEVVLEVGTDAAPEDLPVRGAAPPPSPPASSDPEGPILTASASGAAPPGGRFSGGGSSGGPPDDPEPLLNPKFTFDDFVIGDSNRFAHAAALAVAEQPAKSWNPLFIYGRTGLGKTHLLQGIAHYVLEQYPLMHVRYVSTETFLNEFVDAIRTNAMSTFKRRYRDCHVLLIDDVQFIENKERFQEEFFHTFDHLHSAGRQVVISSDRAPRAIATLEDRLRSRFAGGLITDIQPPDLETRLAILRKRAEGEPIVVPHEVLEYIATHIVDNIRELEGALLRVSAFASLNAVPLTISLAEDVLGDLITSADSRRITPKMILDATAEMFGHPVEELCGKSRSRPLVQARQIGMYVFRELTDFSYPAIGRVFGDRDHTTVMHAVEKVTQLMKERRAIYEQVTALITKIRNGG